jgi:IclR family KDG regulon transcriptional repressor
LTRTTDTLHTRPALKWLTSVTGQTSVLVVLRETDVLYVDIVEGLEPLRFYADLGARGPAYATASGKALLAHRADLIARGSGAWPPAPSRGRRVCAGVSPRSAAPGSRPAGAKRRDDIAAVAAPIFDARGECVASISVSGPRTRFDDTVEEFDKHVPQGARRDLAQARAPGASVRRGPRRAACSPGGRTP